MVVVLLRVEQSRGNAVHRPYAVHKAQVCVEDLMASNMYLYTILG